MQSAPAGLGRTFRQPKSKRAFRIFYLTNIQINVTIYIKGCDKVKYCLSARQPDSVLKKADEIKIELRDFRAIPEYIEKFPNKTLILEFNNDIPEDFSWELIQAYTDKLNGNFICALSDLSMAPECYLRNIKFYYKYTITSFFELDGLKNVGVCYVLIGAPLIFDLKTVASYNIPIRAIPNLAYEPYIEHKNGICGGWIRPEDTDKYGKYIEVFEFYAPKALEKESALYRVYAENKTWPGNLNLLIDYLNADCNNQMIYDEEGFAERRMSCKQKCLTGRNCRYCIDQFLFPETTLKKYLEYKNNN